MNKKVTPIKQERVTLNIDLMAPVITALIVSTFLLLAAGFAQSSTVHNAAHDARHAFAFPGH